MKIAEIIWPNFILLLFKSSMIS